MRGNLFLATPESFLRRFRMHFQPVGRSSDKACKDIEDCTARALSFLISTFMVSGVSVIFR